jgi:hypothetical protein
LASIAVGGEQDPVKVQLEQLLVVAADRRGTSSPDNRQPGILAGVNRFGPTPHEEFVIEIPRREGMECEPGIAEKIGALRRVTQDKRP